MFESLRPALQRAGIAFPAAWSQSADQPSHQRLAAALTTGTADTMRADFAHDHLLISAEDLSQLETPKIQALRTLLGDRDTMIVFYQKNGGARGTEVREWFLREEGRFGLTQIVTAIATHPGTLALSDDEPRLAAVHRRLWAAYAPCVADPHPAAQFFVPAYLANPAVGQQYRALYIEFRAA